MADVRPFRGLRYPLDGLDLAAVLTPPYDVISPDQQAEYYTRDPRNIIRLELGRDEPGDDALANRYTRAAATFADWRLRGDLALDPTPSFYVYQQHFRVEDHDYTRTSLVARVRLEPWEAGVVLPHERTLAKPKDDRLKLLRACAANLSPIMALYDDPTGAISKTLTRAAKASPLVSCIDDAGEHHLLWTITDATITAQLTAAFAEQQLFIADGHHRYETALTFRDEVRALQRGLLPDEAANFVMMALVATSDPGLLVLPTHRLIRGINAADLANLPAALSHYWSVDEITETDAEALTKRLAGAGTPGTVAAIVATTDQRWLVRVSDAGKQRLSATGEPAPWQALDVAAAQELILGGALGIDREAIATGDHVSYVRDAAQALAALTTGTAQIAILLNPTQPAQVRDVASVGGRMPQKSTYFYPKLITGLVINPVW
ncbi:MAG: DUF1015 domain-containing protein [Ktedonobacterales bacterium]|nr:DUF1015 domain-containing protein [Ktedonobacterales bacterium]